MMRWIAVVGVLFALDALACVQHDSCGCPSRFGSGWVARLSFQPDGGVTVDRLFVKDAGIAGPTADELAFAAGRTSGAMLLGPARKGVEIGADGFISCDNMMLAPDEWAQSIADGSCANIIRSEDVATECTGCACTATPHAPAFACALALVLLRARKKGDRLRPPA